MAPIEFRGLHARDIWVARSSPIFEISVGTSNPNSCTFRTRNPTSRLFSDAFPSIASSKRTISLTGIRNTFVLMHVVSYVPNSFCDKQARAAHASWILYGKNLKEITLISTKICYRSILSWCLDDHEELYGAIIIQIDGDNLRNSLCDIYAEIGSQ